MKFHFTKTSIDNLKLATKRYAAWDAAITGLGVRVTPTGVKSYVLKYVDPEGNQKNMTLGRHGKITLAIARRQAQVYLGEVATGNDPQSQKLKNRKAITIGELCDRYLKEGCAHKKQTTIDTDIGRIKRHIKPLLGKKRVVDLNSNTIARFQADVAAGKTALDEKTRKWGRSIVRGGDGTASRTVGLLGGILTFAVNEGIIKANPVQGVKRKPDQKNERYLSDDEITVLWQTLNEAERGGRTRKKKHICDQCNSYAPSYGMPKR